MRLGVMIGAERGDMARKVKKLLEDDKVFAVLGVFIDFTGQGILCLTREHDVIHIGHELDQPWIDESPPGILLTPDTTNEGAAGVLLYLLISVVMGALYLKLISRGAPASAAAPAKT